MARELLVHEDPLFRACVGHGGAGPHEIWFESWFLSQCCYTAPKVVWQRDGRKVTGTWDTGKVRVWMLTDRYNRWGCRLGVWPD